MKQPPSPVGQAAPGLLHASASRRRSLPWLAPAVAGLLAAALAGCTAMPGHDRPTSPASAPPSHTLPAAQGDHVVVTVRNTPWTPPPPQAASTGRGYGGHGVYLAGSRALATARRLAATHGLTEVASWPIEMLGVHCLVFTIAPGTARDAVLDALRLDPGVESAQPLLRFDMHVSRYNDPYARLQANLDDLGVPAAQGWTRGEGVRVAVIDTGVDTDHPDFGGRLPRTRDFVADGRREGEPHGTSIAGLIAAVPHNGIGIAGIAPAASLLPLRGCWASAGGTGACNTFTLAQALAAADAARADVVNLSLGGPSDPLLGRIVERLLERGVVVVGAVPPTGQRAGFPTGIAGVIAVDAIGSRAPLPRVLYAPGTEVFTLTPAGRYDAATGSSVAAAEVSGVAALLLAARPGLPAVEIEALLRRSAASGLVSGGPQASSVHACRALQALEPAAKCHTSAVAQAR